MRPRKKMNHGRGCCQEDESQSHEQARASPQKQTERPRKRESDDRGGQEDYTVQARDLIEPANQHIAEPLPGEPRLARHGRGKWIAVWNRMSRQNQLTVAN